MELKQGRPQEKRIAKEERVYDLLEKLHIDYQRIDHEKADTMEICLEIEKSLQATIFMHFFITSKRKAGTVDLFRYIFCFEFFMFF